MSWALATAGGKDATLALQRARAEGLEVRWALNVFEGDSELVRFHGTPRSLLEQQARMLGLEPRFGHTHPRSFEEVFTGLLADLAAEGAEGVVFGNLHLEEIREWYESHVRGVGLKHVEPLWGADPEQVLLDVLAMGFRATVISVNLEMAPAAWLGRELDRRLVDEILAADVDPCGERGEYHTLVQDGPGFLRSLSFRVQGEAEREGHRYLRLL